MKKVLLYLGVVTTLVLFRIGFVCAGPVSEISQLLNSSPAYRVASYTEVTKELFNGDDVDANLKKQYEDLYNKMSNGEISKRDYVDQVASMLNQNSTILDQGSSILKNKQQEYENKKSELGVLQSKYNQAVAQGNTEEAAKLEQEYEALRNEIQQEQDNNYGDLFSEMVDEAYSDDKHSETAPTSNQTETTSTQTVPTSTQTTATDTQTTPTSTQTTPTSTQTTPTSSLVTPNSSQTSTSTSYPSSGGITAADVLGQSNILDNDGNVTFGYDVQKGADNLNTENANANSSTEAQASIAGCSGDVFQQIQCKVLQFLSNLRTLAYVLAGFGLIMFAYAAIFNKVNMKHLASIGMGLFLLAMMGPFIEYFSGNSSVTTALGYGNFMGDQFTYVQGSGAQAAVDQNQIPDTSVANNNTAQIIGGASTSGSSGSDEETQKNTKKFSLGDIINFGKSAIRTVKDVSNAIQGTDWSLSNIGGIINNIQNTIAGNQNGFDSIGNLAQIAGGIMNGGGLSQIDVNSELKRGQDMANSIQDLFSTKTTRTENRAKREQGENTNKLSNWLDNLGNKINGNSAEKINLSDEQKAVQDYINEQESSIEEAPLPQ